MVLNITEFIDTVPMVLKYLNFRSAVWMVLEELKLMKKTQLNGPELVELCTYWWYWTDKAQF